MISQRAINYAKVLYSLELQEATIKNTKNLLASCGELVEALENPSVKQQEKEAVIEALFEKEIYGFLKVLCENNIIGKYAEIFNAYEDLILEQKNILKARLTYAIKPGEEELGLIKKMLCDKYEKTDVLLELEEDASLIGGYVLHIGNMEYDKSIKGALSEMQKTLIRR
jgi:ATP synthase, F1 delta subunit